MMAKTVLAIDPGSMKCGLALVHRAEDDSIEVIWRQIVPRTGLIPKLHEAYAARSYELIIIGGGTTSDATVADIRDYMPSMGLLVVDEKETTIMAREKYWKHHKRKGWRRLLPASLQMPPEPVDDFVAVILAERVLHAS